MAQLIELTGRSALDHLQGFVARAKNMRPVLLEIGEDMAESTKGRFATATGPDGTAWAPNSALTLARYSANFARKKDGEFTKRSAAKLAAKKPGTGETRALGTTINYQLQGDDAVAIGSPMVTTSSSTASTSKSPKSAIPPTSPGANSASMSSSSPPVSSPAVKALPSTLPLARKKS